MANIKWKMENGKWKMENGKWRGLTLTAIIPSPPGTLPALLM
ncbi:MAG: hypothetical protein ACREA2_24980 [Blastocatellia bacterium]